MYFRRGQYPPGFANGRTLPVMKLMLTVGFEGGYLEGAEAWLPGCRGGVSELIIGRSIVDGLPSAEGAPDPDAGCGSQVEGIAGVVISCLGSGISISGCGSVMIEGELGGGVCATKKSSKSSQTTDWPLLGVNIAGSLGTDSGCLKLINGDPIVDDCPQPDARRNPGADCRPQAGGDTDVKSMTLSADLRDDDGADSADG